MTKLIVLTLLLLIGILVCALLTPVFEARALVANPPTAPNAMPQTQTPRPIRTLPGLEEVGVWLGPTIVDYSFVPNHAAMTARHATLDSSSFDMRPPAPEGRAQSFDIFYSNADGTLNPDGAYLTFEAVSFSQAEGAGGGNVAEVGLRFSGSTTFEYGFAVASFATLGNNANPASISYAVDANPQTYTTLGNTVGTTLRLRITIGFLSSLGPPPSELRTVSIEDAEIVGEGNTGTAEAVFKVRLSSPGPAPVTVAYSTQDFTAAAPGDYTASSGTLTFPANSSNRLRTITVLVRGDTLYEAAEQFFVNLSGPINAGIERGQATGTITDDDPGVLTICSNTPMAIPGTSTITVPRDGIIDDVKVGLRLSLFKDGDPLGRLNARMTPPDDSQQTLFSSSEARMENLAGNQVGTTCSPSPDCVFDDSAFTRIYDGIPPYTGDFKPDFYTHFSDLGRRNPKGAWRLSLSGNDPGTLACWCLTFGIPREGCNLKPANARASIFSIHTVRAFLTSNGAPVANQVVSFEVRGEQGELRFRRDISSDAYGTAELGYRDFKPGDNRIEARAVVNGVPSIAIAQVTWVADGFSNFSVLALCPIEESTGPTPEAETTLATARSFRDDVLAKSPRGKAYTELYYRFSSEAVRVMMFSPMLMLRSREIIERYKPVIQSMVNGEQVALTRGDLDEIDGFLNSFAAQGSPQLQQAVRDVCKDLNNPNVHDELHITVIEGPKRELPAHHLPRSISRAGDMASLLGFSLAFVLFIARSCKRALTAKASGSLCVVLATLLIGAEESGALAQARATALSRSFVETDKTARSRLGGLPLAFEANQGQVHSEAQFLSRANKYSVLLKPTEAVIAFERQDTKRKRQTSEQSQPIPDVLRMRLLGGDPSARMAGLDELRGKTNYFVGKDSTRWRANVPNYSRVKCEQVYPGIDIVYYGNQRELEYDFVVAPGADPRAINLHFEGTDRMEIDWQGDLMLHVAGGLLRQRKPVAYQVTDGIRREVACRYKLLKERSSIRNPQSAIRNCLVGFATVDYDTTKPLIIDPVLTYSTYLGGGGDDEGNAITVDAAGNIYVVGFTGSTNFPTTNPSQPTLGGGQQDVFVTKLNPAGSQLIYSTYIGGNSQDNGSGIAVDSAGNAYITGFTGSTNFPMRSALQPAKNGPFNAFVAKLDPTGALLYSTHLGGSVGDYGSSITVDSSGNVYLAGVATSLNFPMVNALQPSHGGAADLYVAKLNPSGSQLLYSTYLGGTGNDGAAAIAVDSTGSLYLTGVTSSQNFRTASPLQASHGGGLFDAFVAKVNPSGNQLVYSTYLGGGGEDRAFRIAVDSPGNAYVTGDTDSTNFPIANALQRSIGGSVDAFVSKINPTGSALVFSTYLGGSALDGGTAIALDSAGSAYAAGFTGSANFPTIDPVQQANGGGSFDAFVAKLSSSGAALEWSTYLGGSGIDAAFGIAVDSTGNAYLMGQTQSTDFPTASPLQQANGGGPSDLFIAKIVPTPGAGPRITGASVSGKKLFVVGNGFDSGAKILINGDAQKTSNDDQNPATALVAKKSGKKIGRGETVTLRVRNSDGALSNEFSFTR